MVEYKYYTTINRFLNSNSATYVGLAGKENINFDAFQFRIVDVQYLTPQTFTNLPNIEFWLYAPQGQIDPLGYRNGWDRPEEPDKSVKLTLTEIASGYMKGTFSGAVYPVNNGIDIPNTLGKPRMISEGKFYLPRSQPGD